MPQNSEALHIYQRDLHSAAVATPASAATGQNCTIVWCPGRDGIRPQQYPRPNFSAAQETGPTHAPSAESVERTSSQAHKSNTAQRAHARHDQRLQLCTYYTAHQRHTQRNRRPQSSPLWTHCAFSSGSGTALQSALKSSSPRPRQNHRPYWRRALQRKTGSLHICHLLLHSTAIKIVFPFSTPKREKRQKPEVSGIAPKLQCLPLPAQLQEQPAWSPLQARASNHWGGLV